MKIYILIILAISLLIPISIAEIEISNPGSDVDRILNLDIPEPPTNFSLIPTVNSSDFWDDLDTPADILGSLINNNLGWITTDTNASTECNDGEYLDGSSACINLNDTVDSITASTTYNATNIITVFGTLDSGDVNSIRTAKDGDTYNVSEAAGADAILITINFTGVESFNQVIFRELYEDGSGHTLDICLWDYNLVDWDCSHGSITDMDKFAFTQINVLDSAAHISGGVVSLKFDHVESGNPSHDFFLDYVVLIDGFSAISSEEVDPFAFHLSGDTIMQGNGNWGGFNLTNIDWLNGFNNINGSGNISANIGFFEGIFLPDTKILTFTDTAQFYGDSGGADFFISGDDVVGAGIGITLIMSGGDSSAGTGGGISLTGGKANAATGGTFTAAGGSGDVGGDAALDGGAGTTTGGKVSIEGGTGATEGIVIVGALTDTSSHGLSNKEDLLISGKLEVDGAAFFDAAVDMFGELTVGADTDGHDVKFFGDTTGKYFLWDESENKLEISGNLTTTGKISLEFGDLVSEQNPDGADAIRIKGTSDVDVVIGDMSGLFTVWNVADDTPVFYVNERGDTDIAGDFTTAGGVSLTSGKKVEWHATTYIEGEIGGVGAKHLQLHAEDGEINMEFNVDGQHRVNWAGVADGVEMDIGGAAGAGTLFLLRPLDVSGNTIITGKAVIGTDTIQDGHLTIDARGTNNNEVLEILNDDGDGSARHNIFNFRLATNSANFQNSFGARKSGGTIDSPEDTEANEKIFQLISLPYRNGGFRSTASIGFETVDDFNDTSYGQTVIISTTIAGSTAARSERFRIDGDGGTNITGRFTVGKDDTGHVVQLFGDTSAKYVLWNNNPDELEVTGTTLLTGATVSTGGLTMNSALEVNDLLTVGENGDGEDVTFFSSIAGRSFFWDETNGLLKIIGEFEIDGNITLENGGKLWDNSTCTFLASPDGSNILEVCNT